MSILYPIFDYPIAGQFGFQTPATPMMEGIIECFIETTFIVLVICIVIFWVLFRIVHFFETETGVNAIRILDTRIDLPLLEFIWTIIPSAILLLILGPAFALIYGVNLRISPELTVKIIGRQWYWTFELAIGGFEKIFDSTLETEITLENHYRLLDVTETLFLPLNTSIRLLITSSDVLHSFAVPALGVKTDACPGRLNQVLLYINRPGTFFGQCSEICGVNHGFMPIKVKVMPVNLFLESIL
jgi:cytochrome c oxidase subunit 2